MTKNEIKDELEKINKGLQRHNKKQSELFELVMSEKITKALPEDVFEKLFHLSTNEVVGESVDISNLIRYM